MTGSRSKSKVLIHEFSHFTRVGGSIDHSVGEEQTLALATNDPGAAVESAENLAYFAVNTPFLF
jgi:peptidyl-Lys metalloendopeptidase